MDIYLKFLNLNLNLKNQIRYKIYYILNINLIKSLLEIS